MGPDYGRTRSRGHIHVLYLFFCGQFTVQCEVVLSSLNLKLLCGSVRSKNLFKGGDFWDKNCQTCIYRPQKPDFCCSGLDQERTLLGGPQDMEHW